MIYQNMQQEIERRYDLHLPCQVKHFVSHDEKIVKHLTGMSEIGPEVLLVREDSDALDITLFLEKDLVESIMDNELPARSGKAFDDYCTILEGVSHFVYLVWNAQFGRQVKPIEMELQAEVDKFVFSALEDSTPARERQGGEHGKELRELLVRLFQNIRFTHAPGTALYYRYRTANALAYRYCQWLCSHFHITHGNPMLYAELARFYRMSATAKFAHIRKAPKIEPQLS